MSNILSFANNPDPNAEHETFVTAMVNSIIETVGTDASTVTIVNALLSYKWTPGQIASCLNDVCARVETFHRTYVDKPARKS